MHIDDYPTKLKRLLVFRSCALHGIIFSCSSAALLPFPLLECTWLLTVEWWVGRLPFSWCRSKFSMELFLLISWLCRYWMWLLLFWLCSITLMLSLFVLWSSFEAHDMKLILSMETACRRFQDSTGRDCWSSFGAYPEEILQITITLW